MLPNIVLFQGQDALNDSGLWETNGTGSGTFELAPSGTGAQGLSPSGITVLGGQVLFEGVDLSGDSGLWSTDGTAVGTVELTGIAGASSAGIAPADLTVFGSEALFSGINASGQTGLWTTNGTANGTLELAGIIGAAAAGVAPTDLTVFNDEVLFTGTDTAGDLGLWVTNGTAGGTHELTGIGSASSTGLDPTEMTVFNNEVLFNGVDANGLSGLWVTDGTVGGTHQLFAGAGGASDPAGLNPTNITVYNGEVLFSGLGASGDMNLWVSDGTAGGTHELTGVVGADSAGLAPSDLTVYNGEVLFRGLDQSGRAQLWVTNGTVAGTQELIGVVGAATTGAGFDPSGFAVYDGMVLFSGVDSSGNTELWETNGTAAGTTEIDPSSATESLGLFPLDMTALAPSALTAVAPTISGTHATPTTADAPVDPFSGVRIGDQNASATDTLTITLSSNGTTGRLSGTGLTDETGDVYTLTGTAAAITASLDALRFTPATGAPGSVMTTLISLSDLSSGFATPTADGATTVTDTDPPPTSDKTTTVTDSNPTWVVAGVLNNFSWAEGWNASTNYVREVVETTANGGGADYLGFGSAGAVIAIGERTPTGPGFATANQAIHNFGTAQGYTTSAQRGAADTGDSIAPTVYGQGFKGVYWYDATGGTGANPTYQSTPNLYPNFGTQQGWTPANGFDVVKADGTDAFASILGLGNAGIVVGPQAFNPATSGSPPAAYLIPFAAGNNFGWSQTTDIRSFVDSNGQAIDLNGDGVTDFVGMGPQGLEFAFGSDINGHYSLGPLQLAQINGTKSNFGDSQGWNDSNTTRDIVKDPTTGFDDIIAFGAAGVYVSMGQDPSTHEGQPFGHAYLALNNFGSNQGWSNTQTPRLVGDVSGDGIPDIVGFGANSTLTALGSYNSSGQLIFTMDPAATINNYGYTEGWSESNTVRTLANVDGSGSDSLVVSGASGTNVLKFG
jgi:ELWxxDGT repeat protein